MGKKIFFSSSACAYNKSKQQEVFIGGLKETDYPADPEDGYGWENYLVNVCVDILWRIMVEVRIARYYNVYGLWDIRWWKRKSSSGFM